MICGMKIIASPHWPVLRDPENDKIIRRKAHSLICWLAKFTAIEPYVEFTRLSYRDADPIVAGGFIFCALRQRDQIERMAAKASMGGG